MYESGQGTKKNLAKAAAWYRKAADQGDASSQVSIGVMYENGESVKKDDAKAVEWYRKAAEQGNARGQTYLGLAYENGQSVTKDEAEAVSWYRKAAEQGNAQAQTNLGNMYENGKGVEKDLGEAASWYRKAAEQGNARAESNLGDMYYSGEGAPKDRAEAASWFRKAADQGSAYALYSLGFMYARGDGVQKDEDEAMSWLRKASDQGHEGAKKEIARIESLRLQAKQELAAKQEREENERKLITQVGQKICRVLNSTNLSLSTGWQVMGETVYQEYLGKTEFVGFVEGSSGNRIQIRISGMTFSGAINSQKRMGTRMPENVREQMDSFTGYKGSNLKIGGIIWDDYNGWTPCSYN
jgi:TPR repeat protein